jgi:toxin ParE1/3/4
MFWNRRIGAGFSQGVVWHCWEKAVTSSLNQLVRHPFSGSLCSFSSFELRDVRRTMIPSFPKHLLFYRFAEGEIFVLRIVHGARDLETLFS